MASRHSVTIDQRRALRRWAHRQHPKPTQKQSIEWFLLEYNHKLSQSTISESLGSRFAFLDDDDYKTPQTSRIREGYWPDLEQILFTWQQRIDSRGGFTSGELLQAKAKEIWAQLPQYANKPVPEFSTGWLEGFKKRFQVSSRVRHGEAGSTSASAEQEMRSLQTVAGEYEEDNVYNMDESGLFWRMMPSRGLSSQSQPGLKKDKARITFVLATNATGTDRVPVWFIGKAKTPRALRNISVPTMGGQWRWNNKAWMNTVIMVEWLQSFYQQIGTTRQVLLTMDNFSAHYTAVEQLPPPSNIRICWLPANSTSRFQPLDQGIIQNCKAYYRRHWLQHMLHSFDSNTDPHSTMNLRLAIRWILRSWNSEVTNTTIYNCFRKSTLISSPISLPTPIIPLGITDLYQRVVEAGNIRDAMAIANFLSPADEVEAEDDRQSVGEKDILQEVIQDHLGLQSTQDNDEDDEQLALSVHTASDALQALHVLIEFTEGQESLSTNYIRVLERMESGIEGIQQASLIQSTLDSWIT